MIWQAELKLLATALTLAIAARRPLLRALNPSLSKSAKIRPFKKDVRDNGN